MTIAELVLKIRRRAACAPQDLPRNIVLEEAIREVLGQKAAGANLDYSRQLLTDLLGLDAGHDFDPALLDTLTLETIFRLDLMVRKLSEQERL